MRNAGVAQCAMQQHRSRATRNAQCSELCNTACLEFVRYAANCKGWMHVCYAIAEVGSACALVLLWRLIGSQLGVYASPRVAVFSQRFAGFCLDALRCRDRRGSRCRGLQLAGFFVNELRCSATSRRSLCLIQKLLFKERCM